jgi:hypothetical protein
MDRFVSLYLSDIVDQFRQLKVCTERALAQVSDDDLVRSVDAESNSIAALLQHMSGNLKSRWQDFLTTDGEKPDRDRDAEFVVSLGVERKALLAAWEEGWEILFATLAALGPDDLLKTIPIRGEPHTVPRAIHRQLTHQAYHVGQVVLLARHFAGEGWKTLTVPKGKSREFNAKMFAAAASR